MILILLCRASAHLRERAVLFSVPSHHHCDSCPTHKSWRPWVGQFDLDWTSNERTWPHSACNHYQTKIASRHKYLPASYHNWNFWLIFVRKIGLRLGSNHFVIKSTLSQPRWLQPCCIRKNVSQKYLHGSPQPPEFRHMSPGVGDKIGTVLIPGGRLPEATGPLGAFFCGSFGAFTWLFDVINCKNGLFWKWHFDNLWRHFSNYES